MDSVIPEMTIKASPLDKVTWVQRLKEEYNSLIQYVRNNKKSGNDWFTMKANTEGTLWTGTCHVIVNKTRHSFEFSIEIPAAYPMCPPEIIISELDGKTAKMYRGGRICLDDHFCPLWAKNIPKFGISHCLAYGLLPWLTVEIPSIFGE